MKKILTTLMLSTSIVHCSEFASAKGSHNHVDVDLNAQNDVNFKATRVDKAEAVHIHYHGNVVPPGPVPGVHPKSPPTSMASPVHRGELAPQDLLKIKKLNKHIKNHLLSLTPTNINEIKEFSITHESSFNASTRGVALREWLSCHLTESAVESLNDILQSLMEIPSLSLIPCQDGVDGNEGEVLSAISHSFQFLTSLQELHLENCSVTDDHLRSLMETPRIGNLSKDLSFLNIKGTQITGSMLSHIQEYFKGKKMTIEHDLDQKPSASKSVAAAAPSPSVMSVSSPSRSPSRTYPEIAIGYEQIYERFMNGALVYKPNSTNDVGKLTFPFRDWVNPETLRGTCDLSTCGDAGQYLIINSGYRTQKSGQSKVEVFITPRFLVEKEMGKTLGHYSVHDEKWISQVGILFSWGKWDYNSWGEYQTKDTFDEISSQSLYQIIEKSPATSSGLRRRYLAKTRGFTYDAKFLFNF